jgi:diguanylate cyclase (GGDEF)-like protein
MIKVQAGMTIGRSVRADFRTPDDGVSRLHVKIESAPEGGMMAQDMGSRNGTFVNGAKIDKVALRDGDKIRIGSTTILKFSYADRLDESFQQQMYNAALRDPLTQIYNRRHFDEQLNSEFSYAVRHGFPLALIMMDLDHFKLVNDTHGHLAGDTVLVGLADILINSTRQEDLFARYGGEEFALLCRGTTAPVSFSIANRIRRMMEQAILVPELPDMRVTLSAGVAGIPDAAIGTSQELIEAADRALYRAKELGRNRVCIYDAELAPTTDTPPPGTDTKADTLPDE